MTAFFMWRRGAAPPEETSARGEAVAELVLWISVGFLVLAAHVGAAAWLLRAHPLVPADDMPPAAIMIEFAEAPEATATEQTEISPDQETTEASQPAQKVETSEKVPPEEVPEPVEQMAEAEPEAPDPQEEKLPVLDQVEVPLPVARPDPPAKEVVREEKKKPTRPRQQPQMASPQAVQAQAQVTQSSRNAARQATSGTFSTMSPATWQARLMAHLERRKKYPPGARARGERGTVYVRFNIDEEGKVLSVSLARTSGFAELDQEVLSLVRGASPVPAPPPGVSRSITAPVRFNVR